MIVGFNAIKCTYMCLSRNFVRFIEEKIIDKNFPKCWMGSPRHWGGATRAPARSIPMPVGTAEHHRTR